MNNQALILSQYPVSVEEVNRLREKFGAEARMISVTTIISKGHFQLVQYLRSLQCGHLIIYLKNPQEKPFATVLTLISFFIRSHRRTIFDNSGSTTEIGYLQGFFSLVKMGTTLLLLLISALAFFLRCLWLSNRPRVKSSRHAPSANGVIYLKMTLWLGIQVGGARTHALGVVRSLLARGFKVFVETTEPNEFLGLGEGAAVSGAPIHLPYATPRELNHFVAHWIALLRHSSYASEKNNIRFIYQRLSVGNFVGVELSRRYKVPLIVEYNGSEVWLSENWGTPYQFRGLVQMAEALMLRHAQLIVVVSDALKRSLIEKGYEPDRIIVSPNGINPEDLSEDAIQAVDRQRIREELGADEDSLVFTFVGTFGPWHGAEVFARAILKFYENCADEKNAAAARFLFVGDGVMKAEVESLLAELVKKKKVTFAGVISNKRVFDFLVASDVCVLPTKTNADSSEFFGSPTKLFEYMLAAKPVIASRLGQVNEVLSGSCDVKNFELEADPDSTGQIGIFIRSNNPMELASAFEKIIRYPEWRIAAGAHARQRVLRQYTWERSTASYIGALEEYERIEKEDNRPLVLLINGLHSKSGGGVTYLRNILEKFTGREDLKVNVLLQKDQANMFGEFRGNVHSIKINNTKSLPMLLFKEQFFTIYWSQKLAADVVFSPANFGPLLWTKSVILLRNAIGVKDVEDRFFKRVYWQLLYIATLISIKRASRVISVSKYAMTGVTNIGNTEEIKKIQIIPHGVSSLFSYDETIKREPNRLLFVSDLYVQKNLHTLLKALAILKEKVDFHLDVVGAAVDQNYRNWIVAQIKRLKLESRVTLRGHAKPEELREYYSKCSVFVFPSTVETFGNPLVEAMACGAPIACSNSAAMPEVAGDAVMYFDPGKVDDMADVICTLLSDPEKRESLGVAARERAKIYSWTMTADATARVFHEVVGR